MLVERNFQSGVIGKKRYGKFVFFQLIGNIFTIQKNGRNTNNIIRFNDARYTTVFIDFLFDATVFSLYGQTDNVFFI